jgi:hypothetical protein
MGEIITKIFKYTLIDSVPIALPINAKIIEVSAQQNYICLWALVDDAQPTVPTHFKVICTGVFCMETGHL